MPWRGPEVPGEYPTLGYQVADWIEAHCAIPDGEQAGEPFILTDEQLRFILQHYRLKPGATPKVRKPSAAFEYRRSQLVRPQKWGKGPFSAAIIGAEAAGPVLFDGWDASGEPVGKQWATPWIQVVAVSEDQTDNVWTALVPMIELGALTADIPDTGKTRINVQGLGGSWGKIEPVTSSARSRLGPGQRVRPPGYAQAHQFVPGRVELHLVHAVAEAVVRLEDGGVAVRQLAQVERLRPPEKRAVFQRALLNPRRALAPHGFPERRVMGVEVVVLQGWRLVEYLVRGVDGQGHAGHNAPSHADAEGESASRCSALMR